MKDRTDDNLIAMLKQVLKEMKSRKFLSYSNDDWELKRKGELTNGN